MWFSSPAQDTPVVVDEGQNFSWFGSSDESLGNCGGLSYRNRLMMFFGLLAVAALFFFFASMSVIFPVKFAKLFFLGSFFLISSLAFLVGPQYLLVSAFQRDRVVSTVCYISTAIGTIVCATVLESTILTLVVLIAQFFCAGWLALSFLPFGRTWLGFAAKNVLPI